MKHTEIFNEEKVNDLVSEQTDEIMRLITPIVSQIVLLKIRKHLLPPLLSENGARTKEHAVLMDYYVNVIHQVLGYEKK